MTSQELWQQLLLVIAVLRHSGPTFRCSSGLDLGTRGFALRTRTIAARLPEELDCPRITGYSESWSQLTRTARNLKPVACRQETTNSGKPITYRGRVVCNSEIIVDHQPLTA
jgi:hypothetical protein